MLTSDFDFDLPEELIAQYPLEGRSSSRLMHVDPTGEVVDRQFVNLPDLLTSNDLLVFNDTRVIPARLYGKKETGGKVELLIERLTSATDALAYIRSSKSPKPGSRLIISGQVSVLVTGRQGALFCVRLEQRGWMEVLAEFGHMPLPPYIQRDDSEFDEERYQTVYAKNPGAVAAPTAGLHFDQEIFDALEKKGVEREFVTLHVGAGTFQPVKVDDISEHVMHEEYLEVSEELVEKIVSCKQKGGRVVAVGTTSVRSLETAARRGVLEPYRGMSDIFITPGSTFNVVDAMVTNFHLPQSTLLMLVSAFIGHEQAMNAYKHAVNEKYRFFSYGDAMFLEKASNAV